MTELTNQYLHYDKMETDVLKSKKKEVVAETASSSESKNKNTLLNLKLK